MKRENTVIRPAARNAARLPFRPALILLLAAALLLPALTLTLTGCDIADFIGKPATSSGELPDGDGSGTLPETYPVVTDAPVPSVSPALADDGTPRTTEDGRPLFTVKDGEGNVITGTDGAAAEVFFRTVLQVRKPATIMYYAATGEAVTMDGKPLIMQTAPVLVNEKLALAVINASGEKTVVADAEEVAQLVKQGETTYTDSMGHKTTYSQTRLLADPVTSIHEKFNLDSVKTYDINAFNQSANLDGRRFIDRTANWYGRDYDITVRDINGVPLMRAMYDGICFVEYVYVSNEQGEYKPIMYKYLRGNTVRFGQSGTISDYISTDDAAAADQASAEFIRWYNMYVISPVLANGVVETMEKNDSVYTDNDGNRIGIIDEYFSFNISIGSLNVTGSCMSCPSLESLLPQSSETNEK